MRTRLSEKKSMKFNLNFDVIGATRLFSSGNSETSRIKPNFLFFLNLSQLLAPLLNSYFLREEYDWVGRE